MNRVLGRIVNSGSSGCKDGGHQQIVAYQLIEDGKPIQEFHSRRHRGLGIVSAYIPARTKACKRDVERHAFRSWLERGTILNNKGSESG